MSIAPGPKGDFLTGHLVRFRSDVLGLLEEAARDFGDVVRFRLGPFTYHLINSPDGIEHVLLRRHQNYVKHTRSANIIAEICGPSLLTTDGDYWRRQRRLLQPEFQPQRVREFAAVVETSLAQTFLRWDKAAADRQVIDVASEMSRLTFTVVGRALFGADVTGDFETVERSLGIVLEHTYRRLRSVAPSWLPGRGSRQFRPALAQLDQVIYRLITERRRQKSSSDNLLGRLLAAQDDDTGRAMTDAQVRNEAITLLLAGHETTANALAWTWHLVAQNSEVDSALAEENTALALPQEHPPARERSLTSAVFQEALRLYPPIWIFERRVLEADTIAGYVIPPGTTVVVSPYALHRRERFWTEPTAFQPGRFMGDAGDRPQNAYLPFGLGPHQCIGNHFATMEATLIISAISQRYRLRHVDGVQVQARPGITLRPLGGILMRVERRGLTSS